MFSSNIYGCRPSNSLSRFGADLTRSLEHKLKKAAMIFALMLCALTITNSLLTRIIPFIDAQEDAGVGDLDLFPPDSEPYGLTYGEWTAKWWQWAYSMPEKDNPLIDDTGKNCANGQSGPVWFLAGTFGGAVTRECTIPAEKGILVPIINMECDFTMDLSFNTEAELRSCAKADQDTVIQKQVTIDGVNVGNLDKYRFQSPLFELTFPENNVAGVKPQTTKAVSDGYWILLEPLSPGRHEIHSKAALGDPTATGTTNFALDIKYLLTVEEQGEVASTEKVNDQSITLQPSSTSGKFKAEMAWLPLYTWS
jgi:hypothetical protein